MVAICGLQVSVAYAECIFADFEGYRILHNRGSVSMLSCTFQNNNLTAFDSGAAVIQMDPFGGDTPPEVSSAVCAPCGGFWFF